MGRSPKSNLICAVTMDSVPDAPVDLREDEGSNEQDQVEIHWSYTAAQWNGGQDVTEYKVSWGGSSTQKTTATHLKITGLKADTSYTIRVEALNSVGASTAASIQVKTKEEPAPPPMMMSAPPPEQNNTIAIVIIVVIVVLVIAIGVTITLIILRDKKNKKKKAEQARQDKYKQGANTERAETDVRGAPAQATV
jgi:hypothetical protein